VHPSLEYNGDQEGHVIGKDVVLDREGEQHDKAVLHSLNENSV